jgi:hypothetical protein
MTLSNPEKCALLQANIIYFSERAYQAEMQIQVAKASNNQEGVAANESVLAELLLTIKVYQDELAKLETE